MAKKKKVNGHSPPRRCFNPECNCWLRSANTGKYCSICERKRYLEKHGLTHIAHIFEDEPPHSNL